MVYEPSLRGLKPVLTRFYDVAIRLLKNAMANNRWIASSQTSARAKFVSRNGD
jgi:hypothetical protein